MHSCLIAGFNSTDWRGSHGTESKNSTEELDKAKALPEPTQIRPFSHVSQQTNQGHRSNLTNSRNWKSRWTVIWPLYNTQNTYFLWKQPLLCLNSIQIFSQNSIASRKNTLVAELGERDKLAFFITSTVFFHRNCNFKTNWNLIGTRSKVFCMVATQVRAKTLKSTREDKILIRPNPKKEPHVRLSAIFFKILDCLTSTGFCQVSTRSEDREDQRNSPHNFAKLSATNDLPAD